MTPDQELRQENFAGEDIFTLIEGPVYRAVDNELMRQECPRLLDAKALGSVAMCAVLETLADAGFHLLPPDKVRIPSSRAEAEAMNMISTAYLAALK